jgi:thioredoxin-like negative regulator of GroEL
MKLIRPARIALLLLAATACVTTHAVAAPAAHAVVPFVADDYAAALATARAKKLPLFVETWAPWCHTCRSMRAYVFTDPALAKHADRFVWLELDSEKAANAAIVKKLGVTGLPTFIVIDPSSEDVALRWLGGATTPQLEQILDDGRNAVAQADAKGTSAALAHADRLYGARDNAAAAAAYSDVLAKAPADWLQRGRVTESLLFALSDADQCSTAVEVAVAAFPKLRHTVSAANVAAIGLDCASQLSPTATQRAARMATLEADAREVVTDLKLPIAADDRSGVYITLIDARDSAGDSLGALDLQRQWATFLEGEAAKAKNPDARAVFDSHRLSAYLALNEPERAIPMLTASERDLPADYNPSARLATAYKAMKKWDDALAASDRALAKAYGPRQLGILQTRADIYVGRGDAAAARSTLEKALEVAAALPPEQRSERQIASLRKKLDGLSKS